MQLRKIQVLNKQKFKLIEKKKLQLCATESRAVQLVMKLVFYGTQRCLPCQQKPATGPHLEPGELSSQPHTLLHFIHLNTKKEFIHIPQNFHSKIM